MEEEREGVWTARQFHGSAYRRILRLRSRFPAYVQEPCKRRMPSNVKYARAEAQIRR